MSRKGRKAAPAIYAMAKILGLLRSPFATQGRSYRDCARLEARACSHSINSTNPAGIFFDGLTR